MTQERVTKSAEVSEATGEVLYLGGFAVWYSDVERQTRYPDRAESDVEHSYMLTMVALNIANRFYPDLDQATIAQFCMIHDAPEAMTGDIPTLSISDEDRRAKEEAEALAVVKLVKEFPPYWGKLLERYEAGVEPEARFVRLVDKVMPPLTNLIGGGATVFTDCYGVKNVADLTQIRVRTGERLREQYPEFPEVHEIRDEVVRVMNEKLFDSNTGDIITGDSLAK